MDTQSICSPSPTCNGGGDCVNGVCQCWPGYFGSDCSGRCDFNCTLVRDVLGGEVMQGRCVAHHSCTTDATTGTTTCADKYECVCKEGFSGPACNQQCPNRCYGHGDCVNGQCQCRDGYIGNDCAELASESIGTLFGYAFRGFFPIAAIALLFFISIFLFCCFGYLFNRFTGRFGTAAIPMWDYYAKRWRNAPLFEPIFFASASTQTDKRLPK